MDIVPTILQAPGIAEEKSYRGRSLLIKQSTPAAICSVLGTERGLNGASLIVDGLKLIRYGKSFLLFDVKKDPDEARNLIQDSHYRKSVGNLGRELLQICQQNLLNIKESEKKQKLTPKEIEKLRSLGYID